jgi:hypothetical protein
MLGNSKALKINVFTTSFDKYEEQLRNFLQSNNLEIKILNFAMLVLMFQF